MFNANETKDTIKKKNKTEFEWLMRAFDLFTGVKELVLRLYWELKKS